MISFSVKLNYFEIQYQVKPIHERQNSTSQEYATIKYALAEAGVDNRFQNPGFPEFGQGFGIPFQNLELKIWNFILQFYEII